MSEDYSRLHDDSNEKLFSKKNLGTINFASGWELANLLRYGVAANELYNIRYPETAKSMNVLDVGCSLSTFATFWFTSFAKPGRPRLSYTGLEVRQDIVDAANKLWPNSGVNQVTVLHFDAMAERLNKRFKTEFEMILLQEVLEHIDIPNVKNVLKDSYKLLTDEGCVVISSPNPRKLEGQDFVWPENHAYEFSLDEMLAEIDQAGMRPYKICGWLAKPQQMKKKLTPEQRDIYDRLNVAGAGVAGSIMGLIYPEHAECYTILACKKSSNRPLYKKGNSLWQQ